MKALLSRIDGDFQSFTSFTNLQKESHDFVISTLTIDRLEHPINLIRNTVSMLKNGGRFILNTLLPINEYEDGETNNIIPYTRESEKLTLGLTKAQDKNELIKILVSHKIKNIEVIRTHVKTESKNGIQQHEIYYFCGNKCNDININSNDLRIYKTGDLVRYLEDGNIEYLGRIDNQVKMRGFRIELEEVESTLNRLTEVKESVVLAQDLNADKGSAQLAAFIAVSKEGLEEVQAEEDRENLTSQWEEGFNNLYQGYSLDQALTSYLGGWESSYTNSPMHEAEVQEWVDQTVGRVEALKPCRVLELGVGLGLILFRIAPECAYYYATDLSQEGLDVLQYHIDHAEQDLPVKLNQQEAVDFAGIEAHGFDTVIMNSFLQYFPDVDYLIRVLEGAVHATQPGGKFFLADIRHLGLLEIFHSSIQFYQSSDQTRVRSLQALVEEQALNEKHLVVDPSFFVQLRNRIPRISRVEIHLERGHFHNELTKFRYDVILHIEEEIENVAQEVAWRDWQEEQLSIEEMKAQIA